MQTKTLLSEDFFELLNRYPSPHNGQPIVLKQVDATHFELYFETKRGLQAAEVSYLFSFVTMGLFVTYLTMCAEAFGYGCEYVAAQHNMRLVKMNRTDTHQAIWLNQRAVFDDMFDDAVRHELNHWLRYSKNEKEAKMDGLAYDCMELNGRIMKFIVRHYKLLHMPGVSSMLKKYYLRTMSDNSDAYYMTAPFSNEQESFEVGKVIMQVWAKIAAKGYYLHPFGTIMSNATAHTDFLKLARIKHEDMHSNFMVLFIAPVDQKNRTAACACRYVSIC